MKSNSDRWRYIVGSVWEVRNSFANGSFTVAGNKKCISVFGKTLLIVYDDFCTRTLSCKSSGKFY